MVNRGHAKPKLAEETGCALLVCHLNLSDVPRHISLVVACGLQLHPYVDSHSPLGVHFFPVTLKCFFFILSSFCGWLRLRR